MQQESLWQGGAWERQTQRVEPLTIPPVEKKKRRGRKGQIIFTLFLLAIALVVAVSLLLSQVTLHIQVPGLPEIHYGEQTEKTTGRQEPDLPISGVGGSPRLSLQSKAGQALTAQEIYARTAASIVYIEVYRDSGKANAGSGVIMSADGYILTNAHMLVGASAVRVFLADNRVLEAGFVGWQPDYDLAVLKVEGEDLPAARFGNSADLQVGDMVVAIGNPLGKNLRGTMTQGIISAINRSVDMDGTTMPLIQTSAALNPGNSGGALINDRGQVVGITTMKMVSRYETIEGLGFAIPTQLIKTVADRIIATGKAPTPVLGITVTFSPEQYGGLLVQAVRENSDAWAKGLQAGDVIVAVNGVPMTDDSVLILAKETLGVGGSIDLRVNRDGEILDMTIELMDAALFE